MSTTGSTASADVASQLASGWPGSAWRPSDEHGRRERVGRHAGGLPQLAGGLGVRWWLVATGVGEGAEHEAGDRVAAVEGVRIGEQVVGEGGERHVVGRQGAQHGDGVLEPLAVAGDAAAGAVAADELGPAAQRADAGDLHLLDLGGQPFPERLPLGAVGVACGSSIFDRAVELLDDRAQFVLPVHEQRTVHSRSTGSCTVGGGSCGDPRRSASPARWSDVRRRSVTRTTGSVPSPKRRARASTSGRSPGRASRSRAAAVVVTPPSGRSSAAGRPR